MEVRDVVGVGFRATCSTACRPAALACPVGLSARALEDHCGAGGGSPRPALPAQSVSAAAEIRTDPSGSRREGSSPRAISALMQGTVSPSQRAASGRVSAARPSMRITGPRAPAMDGEVQDLCTSICAAGGVHAAVKPRRRRGRCRLVQGRLGGSCRSLSRRRKTGHKLCAEFQAHTGQLVSRSFAVLPVRRSWRRAGDGQVRDLGG
jgi:hypothetical protein